MHGATEEWRWFGGRRVVARMLSRMVLLAHGRFAIDLAVRPVGAATRIVGTLKRRQLELALPGPSDAPTVEDGLSPFFARLNELLSEHNLAHRFAIHSVQKWFGCTVHLLPLARDVPVFFGALALDPDAAASLPRIARLEEVVPRSRLYKTDFKCSARPSDIATLIEEVAAFAGLPEIRVGLTETASGDAFEAFVADGRHRSSATVDNRKYVDIRPVLPLLDHALARRGAPYRLHRCFGDGFEDAIARATPDETDRLATLSFLDNPYEPLGS